MAASSQKKSPYDVFIFFALTSYWETLYFAPQNILIEHGNRSWPPPNLSNYCSFSYRL